MKRFFTPNGKLFAFGITLLLLLTTSCGQKEQLPHLKIAASAVPHAEILAEALIDPEMKGINVEILIVDDYNIPNRALAEGEIDANFFQHAPFLESQIAQFHYPIINFASIEIEPMALYSKKMKKISDLKDKSLIALPSDPSNEGRALLLLHNAKIIELTDPSNLCATILDIKNNPKQLRFSEIDSPMLVRSLEDVDGAIIPTNFALQAELNPIKDSLLIENESSPYVNILVIREEDAARPELDSLRRAMTSQKMKQFILTRYQGAVIPAF